MKWPTIYKAAISNTGPATDSSLKYLVATKTATSGAAVRQNVAKLNRASAISLPRGYSLAQTPTTMDTKTMTPIAFIQSIETSDNHHPLVCPSKAMSQITTTAAPTMTDRTEAPTTPGREMYWLDMKKAHKKRASEA